MADIGETTHDFKPDEFLMKSYIKAHETTVSNRIDTFNRSGNKWVLENLDKESTQTMKALFNKVGVKKFNKVTKHDHYFSLKIDSVKISFSTADLILDRIFINGKSFDINSKESLPDFQLRLRRFLKVNQAEKKTSFLDYLIPKAHAQNYNVDRLEDMVVLNASGVISITYQVKWPWKKSEYAVDLANALTERLNKAYDECKGKSQQLSNFEFIRMDDDMKKIVGSMKTEGKFDRTKLISSLMKKFAVARPVDAQSETDQGKYKPISGSCSSFDTKNPGVIQQMFPTMTLNPTNTDMEYNDWLTGSSGVGNELDAKKGVCDAIDRTVVCMEELEKIENNKVANQSTGVVQKINFSRRSVFEEVNGTKGSSK